MQKNNQGFTMVEIIGVVIIMGVILLLLIPGISKLMAQFRNDYYEKLEDSINESGKDFFTDNKIYLPDGMLESTYVNVSSLISEKYVESLLDYRGNSCELEDQKSYVIVIYKGNGKYEYQTCIDCSKDGYATNKNGTYCEPAWLNGKLDYAYCSIKDNTNCDPNNMYFYYETPREDIREELEKQLHIVRWDMTGTNVLDSVRIGDTKEEGILPTNIDVVDNEPQLDSENKKVYEMIYGSEIDNNKEKLNVIIYKHKAPKVTMSSKERTYISGSWTNKNVVIKLEKNDNFFILDNRRVEKYQWSVNGGSWQDINCIMVGSDESCTISLTNDYLEATYKFRLVNDEGNISDETGLYNVKIDKILPEISASADPNSVQVIFTTDPETKEIIRTVTQYASVSYRAYDDESGISSSKVDSGSCSGSLASLDCTSSSSVIITVYDKAGNSNYDTVHINYNEDLISNVPSITPTPPEESGEQTYTIYYNANGDNCKSEATCLSSTECIVGESCRLATNNYQMANYHDNFGWNTKADGTGTMYGSGDALITNLVNAGGSITLYSYYNCNYYKARTADTNKRKSEFDVNKYPWKYANWDDENNVVSYKYNAGNGWGYGCSKHRVEEGLDEQQATTCFNEEHITNRVWEAYYAACKFCGDNTNWEWCPVHNEEKDIEICDSATKTYSSETCKRGVVEGWTKVSK